MTSSNIPAGSIVVGADGSEHSDRAVTWAAGQASAVGRPLVILHSCDRAALRDTGWLDVQGIDHVVFAQALRAAAATLLEDAVRLAAVEAPDLDVQTCLVDVDPREALLDASASAELVVVGSRGRGPRGSQILGSVSARVARHAGCTVVVCRPPGTPTERPPRVLVGGDGTAGSLPVVEFAFRQASLRGVPLTVMHCFSDVSGDSLLVTAEDHRLEAEHDGCRLRLEEIVSALRMRFPDVDVDSQLSRGLVDECLLDRAPSAELVVVGRRDARGLDRFLSGSCALAVLERASTPVAVVPEGGLNEQST